MFVLQSKFNSSQTTYHNKYPSQLDAIHDISTQIYPYPHQIPLKLARPPSMPLFVCSINNMKQCRGSFGFRIGLPFCSKSYLFLNIFTLLIHLYSTGLHYSPNNPCHYTVFGFCKEGDDLQQEWSMHINKDRSSAYFGGRKRHISYKNITYLFVRKSIPLFLYYLNFFFQGLAFYMQGYNNMLDIKKSM
jgi:hypothetical protein